MQASIRLFVILLYSAFWPTTKTTATASAKPIGNLYSPHRHLSIYNDLHRSNLQHQTQLILHIRGGTTNSNEEEQSEDDEEEEESDDDFTLDDSAFDTMTDDDFQEVHTVGRMVQAWHTTPPLTKAFLTCSFLTTMYGYLTHPKHDFPAMFQLDWTKTIRKLQLWRPITAFFNVGPFGLAYLMTAHFLWTYMSTLERLNHDAPYDFWIMMLFGMSSMVVGYGMFQLSPKFLGHNLSTFLVYVWSRYHEGLEVNMFELFNTRAELLPWFFLAQTFLLEGEVPVLDFLGIVFGHVYHHCKTVGILRAPESLVQWYTRGNGALAVMIRQKYKQISADFEIQ